MRRRLAESMLVLIAALLISTGAWAQTLSSYDTFSAATIDPEKWIGLEFTGPASTEVYRRVVGGQAQLLLRTQGNSASDTGVTNASNRLRLGNANADGVPDILAMEAEMTVLSAAVDACGTNATSSRARAQVVGAFFNNGTGNDRVGDRRGDVIAGVHKVMDSVAGNRVEAFLQRCVDRECRTLVDFAVVPPFTRSWTVGDTDRMRIARDGNNVVFTVDKIAGPGPHGSESVTVSTGGPFAFAKHTFHDFLQSFSMANCTDGAVSAFMDLRVDNVRLATNP